MKLINLYPSWLRKERQGGNTNDLYQEWEMFVTTDVLEREQENSPSVDHFMPINSKT